MLTLTAALPPALPGVTSDTRTVTLTGSGTLDEDLDLLHDGSVRFAENVLAHRAARPGRGARRASCGSRSATTSTTTPNSQILAGENIDIYGDWTNGDAHFGTTMVLRGEITAGCVVSGTGCNALRRHEPTAGTTYLTRIWGDTDVDTFQFGDETGIAGRHDGRLAGLPPARLEDARLRQPGPLGGRGRRRGPLHVSTSRR